MARIFSPLPGKREIFNDQTPQSSFCRFFIFFLLLEEEKLECRPQSQGRKTNRAGLSFFWSTLKKCKSRRQTTRRTNSRASPAQVCICIERGLGVYFFRARKTTAPLYSKTATQSPPFCWQYIKKKIRRKDYLKFGMERNDETGRKFTALLKRPIMVPSQSISVPTPPPPHPKIFLGRRIFLKREREKGAPRRRGNE